MPRKVLTSKAIKNMGEWNSWPLPAEWLTKYRH